MPKLDRVGVLGAGTMGRRIAALFANIGCRVELLDLAPDGRPLAEAAKAALLRERPPALASERLLPLIRPGRLPDDLDRLGGVDWVVEAVVEDLDTKASVLAAAAQHLGSDIVVSTNTSSLPAAAIAARLPEGARPAFLATHFFNPPRTLPLVEVAPTAATSSAVLSRVEAWLERELGRTVVRTADAPGFLANRLVLHQFLAVWRAMEDHGLDLVTVDALTGPLLGRAPSATFATADLVGLDTMALVLANLERHLPGGEGSAFRAPPLLARLVAEGALGDKAGRGFYLRRPDGPPWPLDPATGRYGPRTTADLPSLRRAGRLPELGARLGVFVDGEDAAAAFVRRILADLLGYAAHVAEMLEVPPEVVDLAVTEGYRWQVGPFGLARLLGPERLKALFSGNVPSRLTETRAGRRPSPSRVRRGTAVLALDDRPLWEDDAFGRLEAAVAAAEEGTPTVLRLSGRSSPRRDLAVVLERAEAGDLAWVETRLARLQALARRIARAGAPVVAAASGRVAFGERLLFFAAARRVVHADIRVAFPEMGLALTPIGTPPLLQAVLRRSSPLLPASPRLGTARDLAFAQPAAAVYPLFRLLLTAAELTSALQAADHGLLGEGDLVVRRDELLVPQAEGLARLLDEGGFRPPPPLPLGVPGEEVRALLDVVVHQAIEGGTLPAGAAEAAARLCVLLAGGDAPQGTPLDEDALDAEERRGWLSALGRPEVRAALAARLGRAGASGPARG